MQWFLSGLCYGLVGLGASMSFAGGIIVLVSLCSFMSWIGDKLAGTEDDEGAGEDTQDE